MAVSCTRNVSGHNYKNISVIVDLAMGQIPRSTERISSYYYYFILNFIILTLDHCRHGAYSLSLFNRKGFICLAYE